jgi:hypothetical protein
MSWSDIADWCIILFFLWFALKTFVPSLEKGVTTIIGGILALLIAVSTFLSP